VWTGIIVYSRFAIAAAGDYFVAVDFSGDNITMHMDTAGAIETGHAKLGKPGVFIGARSAAAVIRSGDEGTLLEWVVDSAYRFFPALQDELFGYVLHPADIATNKALAAAGRREPRDIIDLLNIHERYLPLGAVVWAASAKDPGLSPEGIIAEIRRNGRYQQADYDRLQHETPIDAAATARALRAALDEADAFVRTMPAGTEGLLFLRTDGQPVQPDPAQLDSYTSHGGQMRGHWPLSPEISRAMMERYNQQPKP
jgi:hypothetical protein